MPKKRQDAKVEKMYDLYKQGATLRTIAKVFGISNQAIWKAFKRRGLKTRPCQWLPYVIWDGKKYSLRSTSYYARTTKERGLLHRDVWEKNNGPIPKGYDIHHKDGDKSNNDIENLRIMLHSDHTRKHFHICPQCGFEFFNKDSTSK